MIDEFKRQGHDLLKDIPRSSMTDVDWLALLQHHGGVTRLLDVTRSFYVATFFAVESSTTDSAVWCFDRRFLGTDLTNRIENNDFNFLPAIAQYFENHRDVFGVYAELGRMMANHLIASNESVSGVVNLEPWLLNQRLTVQQGEFLFPLNLATDFMPQLCRSLGMPNEALPVEEEFTKEALELMLRGDRPKVLKILIPQDLREPILHGLRMKNITASSLFPGIDGFAKSLNYHASGYRAIDDVRRFSASGAEGVG